MPLVRRFRLLLWAGSVTLVRRGCETW